ncbi:beta-phosphoglucomutase [Amphibacillus marinus]|uniref:Beta-phosphoglucomutase n=1 Tax=Amphibacillus marinus TaxID=872970 RepID=A0A1H8MW60_9BACI|nr:beta-phosphoglucomutase [Amphibacillus marinus]
MIKGLVLDLDGVIADTAEYHYLAWKWLGEQLGIQIDREFNEQLKGISRLESLELILTHGQLNDAFSEVEKNNLAAKKNDVYKKYISEIVPTDILPGINDLLSEAKVRGLKLSIASASMNAPDILKNLKVDMYFDAIVNPASLKHGKPDPEIFIKAAQLLGLSPEQCIGIEDAEAGIEAINGAGMFSVGVGAEILMKNADFFVAETNYLNLGDLLSQVGKC